MLHLVVGFLLMCVRYQYVEFAQAQKCSYAVLSAILIPRNLILKDIRVSTGAIVRQYYPDVWILIDKDVAITYSLSGLDREAAATL